MIRRQKTAFGHKRTERASRDRPSRRTGLSFETLESRDLLASMAWTGGDGILWHNPANWVEVGTSPPVHRVPGSGDDVSIGAGAQVEADTDVRIRSLQVESGASLKNVGGMTVTNGLTNYGTLYLGSKWQADLHVTSGVLLNAEGGRIVCSRWTGDWTYSVELVGNVQNQGTIEAERGYFNVNLRGPSDDRSPSGHSFVNNGTIKLTGGPSFAIAGLAAPEDLGDFEGDGLLGIHFAEWNLSSDWTVPSADSVVIGLMGSEISVGGTLTNPSGHWLILHNSTIRGDVLNNGHLSAGSDSMIDGQLALPGDSRLSVGFGETPSFINDPPSDLQPELTVTHGFTNHGRIEIVLSSIGSGSTLEITNGSLVNASDGTITSKLGVASAGGSNFLNARLENQGAVNVTGTDLQINRQPSGSIFSVVNQTDGTIDVAAGRTLTVGGTAVVNQGAIRLQGNAVVDFAVPVVTIDGQGTLQGEPAGTMHVRGSLLGNTQNVASHTSPGTVWLDGAGTDAVPQLLEVMQVDRGEIDAGYASNLAYGALKLGANTYVKLVDQARNSPGTGAEAAYADSLTVPTGTTLDRNKLRLYARQASIGGDDRGAPSAWHNYANPCDVDGDGVVASLDVLLIITYINAHPGSAALPGSPSSPPRYYDVTAGPNGDGDGLVTALDVLIVINFLNRTSADAGAGEAVAPPADAGTDAWPLSTGFDPSRTSTPPPCDPSRNSDAAAGAVAREIPVAIPASDAPRPLAGPSCSPASDTDPAASDARLTLLEEPDFGLAIPERLMPLSDRARISCSIPK